MRYNEYGEHDEQYLEAVETVFDGFNTRTRSDALESGTLQLSQNFRFDRAGTARVRDSITLKSAPLALDDNTAFSLPFYAYGLPNDDTTTSNNITTTGIAFTGPSPSVTLQFTMDAADNFFVADTLVFIGAITGLTGYTSGNYRISAKTSTTISVVIPGIGGTPSGNTTLGAPKLQDAFVTRVYGSCVFADPKNEGEQYIILAGNANAAAVKISDGTTTNITYDSGSIFIGENVTLIQALNKVYLFRKGQTTLEWNQVLTGSPNFTKVPNGAFTQPIELQSNNNTTVSNGKVEVSEVNHGLETGSTVVIIDSGHTGLSTGDRFTVNKVDDDNFFFYANIDNDGTHSSKYIGRVSDGGGFIHSPAPEFGILHQDRLVVPYAYTSDSSPVKRDQVDEILMSEAFFPDQFDPIFGFGRLFPGTDDKVMGLFSFAQDNLIAFNRNSIFLFKETASLPAKKELVTQELGLVARNTIAQVGNQIIFLSDNGVYGVSFQDLYNLRGNDVPLSEPIQNIFDDINKDQWDRSVGIYFDNRYYLAIPLGGNGELANFQPANNNNCILIFNFLNKKWESIDNVGRVARDGQNISWDIQNLLVAGEGNDRAVYAINSLGGIHKIDGSSTTTDDNLVTRIGSSTQSVPFIPILRTRQFNFQKSQRKKWNEFELQVESNDSLSSDLSIIVTTENNDNVLQLGNLSDYITTSGGSLSANEEVSIRGRIGNARAYGLDAKFIVTSGKPRIKLFKVTGGLSFNSTQPAI